MYDGYNQTFNKDEKFHKTSSENVEIDWFSFLI